MPGATSLTLTGLPSSSRRRVRVECVDGVLRGGVAAAARIDLDAGHRADHDDEAVAAPLERREERLGHPHHSQHVGLVHAAPVLLVGLRDGLEPEGAAGVVDQHGELRQGLGKLGDRVCVGDIEAQGASAHLAGQLLASLEAPRGRDHLEAGGRQGADGGCADPAAGARDQGGAALSAHRRNATDVVSPERLSLRSARRRRRSPRESRPRSPRRSRVVSPRRRRAG